MARASFIRHLFFVVILIFLQLLELCQSCTAPPFTWCDDAGLAEQCGATQACKKYKSDTKNQRLKVTLLYETLCPDCQRVIVEQLKPELWKIARDFVDFEFVPYGNAREFPDPPVIENRVVATTNDVTDISGAKNVGKHLECQHGELECYLNRVHACAIKYLKEQNRWFPFIYCMENELMHHQGEDPEKFIRQCLKSTHVKAAEQQSILTCKNSTQEGNELQKEMARKTNEIWPTKHSFVPWILVQNVSTLNMQFYQSDLVDFLCTWYNGDKTPDGCTILKYEKMIKSCKTF